MADAILDALGTVLTRWTMGGQGGAVAPVAWHGVLGDDAREAELRLLALSGQFLGTLTLSDPAGEVRARADLPSLAKPPLADPLRPRVRRLLQQLREPARRRDLLDFLDSRGWTLHPGDWLPGPHEDVPEIYASWQDWAAASTVTGPDAEPLSAENWDQFPPAARRAAFADLRRHDPTRASALLGKKMGPETADVRLKLVELLATGLSQADRPLLEGLSADRAPRIKALAASLLARLGHGAAGGEDAAELAGFFPLQTKGLLRRTRVIVPQPLKTPAQRNRRTVLMETLTVTAFAEALDIPLEALATAWPWNSDVTADRSLVEMVARSASNAVVVQVAEALTGGGEADPYRLAPLLTRLTPMQRRAAAMALLRARGSFAQALEIVGGDGGIEEAMHTPAGVALLGQFEADDAKTGDHAAELLALGLITSREAARQVLKDLAAAGLIASDPRLDMLRLNAALDQKGAS